MHDQFEDRRVGLRMATFTGPVRDLGGGVQACFLGGPFPFRVPSGLKPSSY